MFPIFFLSQIFSFSLGPVIFKLLPIAINHPFIIFFHRLSLLKSTSNLKTKNFFFLLIVIVINNIFYHFFTHLTVYLFIYFLCILILSKVNSYFHLVIFFYTTFTHQKWKLRSHQAHTCNKNIPRETKN